MSYTISREYVTIKREILSVCYRNGSRDKPARHDTPQHAVESAARDEFVLSLRLGYCDFLNTEDGAYFEGYDKLCDPLIVFARRVLTLKEALEEKRTTKYDITSWSIDNRAEPRYMVQRRNGSYDFLYEGKRAHTGAVVLSTDDRSTLLYTAHRRAFDAVKGNDYTPIFR